MINKDAILNVSETLRSRAELMLAEVSFGLDITLIDTCLIPQAQTPVGVQPAWAIIYFAKGILIGSMVKNMTIVIDPAIDDDTFRRSLQEGCEALRIERRKQGNGVGK